MPGTTRSFPRLGQQRLGHFHFRPGDRARATAHGLGGTILNAFLVFEWFLKIELLS